MPRGRINKRVIIKEGLNIKFLDIKDTYFHHYLEIKLTGFCY